ncbi:MAG: permease [Candidatus Omnitrophica bacterium]|nr:permease [Candidatus Omnitrophota bacterium]
MDKKTEHHCCHSEKPQKKKPWYLSFAGLTGLATLVLLAGSLLIPFLHSFRHAYFMFTAKIWFPVILGLVIGGLIDYYVPHTYISKFLAKDRPQSILCATGLGFLMSACSHGIMAIAMQLYKKGASGPAVVTFMLASPWASLPVTFMLLGLFGAKGALIILGAILIALTTGLIMQRLQKQKWIEINPNTVTIESHFSVRKDMQKRWKKYWTEPGGDFKTDIVGIGAGIKSLAAMIMGWILLGMLLAGLISAYVPAHFFEQYLSSSFTGMVMTLVFATVIEVCSEGSAPLAFALFERTAALGNVFIFLMAGVATDYTELGLIWKNIGRRTALWTLILTLPQIFLFAWLLNKLF